MADHKTNGRFVLLQTVVGDYRREFLQQVFQRLGSDFLLLTGDVYFDGTTKTRVDFGAQQQAVRNRFFLKRRLGFQTGHFRKVIRAERAIMEMNPRLLSNWPIIVMRRMLGRPTCMWGHAWPRKGRGHSTFSRDLMVRLAGNALAYTPSDAEDFRARLPKSIRVFCAPNALYPSAVIYDRAASAAHSPNRFLFIGRLVKDKKPELAVRAFATVAAEMPGSILTIVGSGPEEPTLKELARQHSLEHSIEFLGHVSDVDRLATLFGESVASLSPGYVGLSAIQSFSFGTPMLVADDEPHAPEIAAVHDKVNALYFKANDAADFGRVMKQIWDDRDGWTKRREGIASEVRDNYSVERMVDGFTEFFGEER